MSKEPWKDSAKPAKGSRGCDEKNSINWSRIKGVQMLELHKIHLFHIFRTQFAAAMRSKYGEIADFINDGTVGYRKF